MENMSRLMANFEKMFQERALVHDASERFDKRALLQIHDDSGRVQRGCFAAQRNFERRTFTDPNGNGGAACSLPLERLNPVSFNELKVGKVHRGRVVYGTLCAEANRICGIMTLLEDDNGLVVRLAIYNAAPSRADIKRLYPMGTKLAVKEPYFKIATDGGLLIRVDNPANVVKLVTEKVKRTESLLHVDVEDVRKKGNRCFREQNWDAAAEHYTKCIDAAMLQLKESSSKGNKNIINGLLNAYANRAETWLQMKEFKRALEDSNDALAIDPGHVKALYRKGRALLGLRHYRAACDCLQEADETAPRHTEIQETLGQAKTLYAQSLNGKYDISDYLLGRASSPPEVADFVGTVEIKMTEDGRGRGLYTTRKIRSGQLLLVSNAVAVDYDCAITTVFHGDNSFKPTYTALEDLVATVVSAARKSQRLLRQLYSLHDSSTPGSLCVPAIDLFKADGQEEQNENLLVDVNRLRDIVRMNGFGGVQETFVSKSKIYEAILPQPGQHFRGLWLMPSFINHSCLPNSKMLEVGNAMFIHASKPIMRGEEITISYFDTLLPLPQRQAGCKNWGFKCKCRRCILEHSLRTSLDPITAARFEQLHDKAKGELNAARSHQQPVDANFSACAEFARLSVEAEAIIRSSPLLKTEEEKNWVRASFVSAYLAGAQSKSFLPTMLNGCFASGQKVMEAIQSTVPGDFRNLVMATLLLKDFQRWTGDENEEFITRDASEQARKACISVFGIHSEDVLKELVLQYSNGRVF